MSRSHDSPVLTAFLTWVMGLSLAGAAVMLLIALVTWHLGGLLGRLVLTFAALLVGSLLAHVQLHAGRRAKGAARLLVALGLGAILTALVSCLLLVWTGLRQDLLVWRIWWISMVPSVFVTHLILLHATVGRGSGLVELLTGLCVVWAGLMAFYLGFRGRLFEGIPAAYFWVGALPAAGAVLGSAHLALRRVLRRARPGDAPRRGALAGVLVSYLVVAVAAFYIGRATAPGAPRDDPNDRLLAGRHPRRGAPFIQAAQIENLAPRLKPGDILLTRGGSSPANPWLPGFWRHAGLYVGELNHLRTLGVADHPSVRKHLTAYLTLAADNRPNTVIEVRNEGVVFNSLTRSLRGDYAAVLRPRLTGPQIAAAVVGAFENVGKPCDFNFDLDDTTRVACTQLVRLAYQEALRLPLQRVLGRSTLPANGIARKYAAEAARADRQLDFVCFLDAAPARGRAVEADEAAFRQSADRRTPPALP